ncbi:MAG TPA: methyltransferase domain-containing protein [Anaerolineales bacterium]|nr:methyltransferase domain-containing protein [Anaerolineales bacterium]
MKTFKDIFENIPGGRVLDVATGAGRFVEILKENLASFTEIIGIDNSERAEEAFTKAFHDPNIRFQSMDAHALDFPDCSFDTVGICFSLHHLPDPLPVLREMKRVLRPGGYFIVSEMYRDHQTETQMTHVLLHDWWAAVDTARGVCHNKTYTRQQIMAMVRLLNLSHLIDHNLIELEDDPHDAETLKYLDDIINQYIRERSTGVPGEAVLKGQGEALRQRLHQVGYHNASVLVTVAKK